MQRTNYIDKRASFCKKALNNPVLAAKELKELATGLENCRTTGDIVTALQEILYVSERTVFNDLKW